MMREINSHKRGVEAVMVDAIEHRLNDALMSYKKEVYVKTTLSDVKLPLPKKGRFIIP